MIDYTQVEDYDCPECEWSLHIEKTVWTEFDNHQDILDYIQDKVVEHGKTHGIDKNKPLFPVSKDISIYRSSPYVGYSKGEESSLKEII